jgi:hypothetical protein
MHDTKIMWSDGYFALRFLYFWCETFLFAYEKNFSIRVWMSKEECSSICSAVLPRWRAEITTRRLFSGCEFLSV